MALAPTISASPSRMQARPAQGGVSGASARGSHRLAAALTCERLWAFRYHRMIRPLAKKDYQLLGTLIHTVLAYGFASMLKDPPSWYVDSTLEEALLTDGEGYPDFIRQAIDTGEAFKQHYAGEPWKPLYVEEEFSVTLGQILPDCAERLRDEIITCRTDLVAVWNGEAWIVDHKTSRGGRNGRLARWIGDAEFGLSSQVFQNLWILRHQDKFPIDYPLRGFAIQRVKRSVPYDFDRHPLQPSALAYADAPSMIHDAIEREEQILVKIGEGRKPTPNYAACIGRYGKCDYYMICSAQSREQQQRILDTEFEVMSTPAPEQPAKA